MPATDAELIARARALAPAIRARAAQTAEQRKPHDDSIRDLIDAELIQMFVPKRWGGSEASLKTMLDVVEIISAACPSTGWIAAFYISHNIYVAKFPEATQEELFGPYGYTLLPAASAADMDARKVAGGWEVSGQASWGSGVMHADWVLMSGRAEDGPRSFLMPIENVEVIDNWHFAGMAGTGSNDYVARKVFVPDNHALTAMEFHGGSSEGSRIHANPLYSIPFLASAYCTILPVLTGSLKGAFAEFAQIIARRVRNFSGVVHKDQQQTHVTLGEFEIATRAASELARATYGCVDTILHSRPFELADRLAIKGQTAFISKLCRDTVNAMMGAAGASNFHLDQPLQRIWRDLNTVCSHAFWDWDVSREQTGRMQLGLPTNHPLI
ncbi:acyl-CoA dehydrogenase family protein [Novosphingobium sp.]|uniref:acyl-CoA dehydrogenase family protein n=1 Tax=Novosphingobium sp. TaxID=1874826 RepID=UPI0035B278FE